MPSASAAATSSAALDDRPAPSGSVVDTTPVRPVGRSEQRRRRRRRSDPTRVGPDRRVGDGQTDVGATVELLGTQRDRRSVRGCPRSSSPGRWPSAAPGPRSDRCGHRSGSPGPAPSPWTRSLTATSRDTPGACERPRPARHGIEEQPTADLGRRDEPRGSRVAVLRCDVGVHPRAGPARRRSSAAGGTTSCRASGRRTAGPGGPARRPAGRPGRSRSHDWSARSGTVPDGATSSSKGQAAAAGTQARQSPCSATTRPSSTSSGRSTPSTSSRSGTGGISA